MLSCKNYYDFLGGQKYHDECKYCLFYHFVHMYTLMIMNGMNVQIVFMHSIVSGCIHQYDLNVLVLE